RGKALSGGVSTIMSARVLVLGAAGRLGHAAAETFRDAGWSVASLVRPGNASRAPADTEIVEIHALDHAAVAKTAGGADVILHALNPPYTDWSRLALPLAYSPLTAAETTGATLLFPANLYNYGSPLPSVIDEATPMRPSSRKGQLRVAIEDRISEAAERGMRVICARAIFMAAGAGRGSISWSPKRPPVAASPIPGRSTCCTNGLICPISRPRSGVLPPSVKRSQRSRASAFPATPSPAAN